VIGIERRQDMVEAPQPFPRLAGLRVSDAMHPGLISCSPGTSLLTVARMMATYRVHAILVTTHGEGVLPGGSRWGIVSDAALLRAAESGELDDQEAGAIATSATSTVDASEPLACAAQLMLEQEASHLIVVEPQSARPFGVLSTLDVARALAGFPERHPAGPR
jgi:CBS domain-containing protein